jgi:hypothetical protein
LSARRNAPLPAAFTGVFFAFLIKLFRISVEKKRGEFQLMLPNKLGKLR